MKNTEALVKSLKEKLDWYTYEASPEEFSSEEVESILKLLSTLEPIPETEQLNSDKVLADIIRKQNSQLKKRPQPAFRIFKIGLAALIFVMLVITGTTICPYATGTMGFFKFISKTDKGWSFMVTGQQSDTYQSWDELPTNLQDKICIPCAPTDFDLENIIYTESNDTFNLYATYASSYNSIKLSICNRAKEYSDSQLITVSDGISIYASSTAYYFNLENCYYRLSGNIADADTAIALIKEFFP